MEEREPALDAGREEGLVRPWEVAGVLVPEELPPILEPPRLLQAVEAEAVGCEKLIRSLSGEGHLEPVGRDRLREDQAGPADLDLGLVR